MKTLLEEVRTKESIYVPVPARIVKVEAITALEKLYTLALPNDLRLAHEPGQFVQLTVFGVGEAPISITSSPSRSIGTFELAIRKVGDLTNAIHSLSPGRIVGVRGPFGRGFPLARFRGKDLLLVAGGCGMAPLRSLINQVLDERGNYGNVQILYGVKSPAEFMFKEELRMWAQRSDVELHLTVDAPDLGWNACVGYVATLFPEVKVDPRNTVAAIIGPPVMYKSVIAQCKAKGIADGNLWVSFERRMRCGVGKCGHCQMNHIYTCQRGPAFMYTEIKGLEEAFA